MPGITDEFDDCDDECAEGSRQHEDKYAPYILELQGLGRGRFVIVTELVDVPLFPPFVVHRLNRPLLLKMQNGAG